MMLADGNAEQYELLKKVSCETYLFKLENFIDKIVTTEKRK